MEKSGRRANQQGTTLERSVEDMLREGYEKVSAKRFFAANGLSQPIYARQCAAGVSLYRKPRKVDFILYHPQKWPDCLVIECKWQSSSGSVEEKFPFLVQSIEKNNFPTIIVLDGGGYSPDAETWLKAQAGKLDCKLRRVLSLGEFARFRSKGKI